MWWRSRAMMVFAVLAVFGLLLGTAGTVVTLAGPRDEEPAEEEAGDEGGGENGERNDRDRSNEEPAAEAPLQLDSDGDFIADVVDNCPGVANIGQQDMNGDGFGDACQPAPDSDGDGAGDDVDNCPDVNNPNQADGDGNGIGNACDVAPEEPPAEEPPANDGGDDDGGDQGNRDAASEGSGDDGGGGDDRADESDNRERTNRDENRDEPAERDRSVEDAPQSTPDRLPRVRDVPSVEAGIREPGPPPVVKPFDPPEEFEESFEVITRIDAGAGAKSDRDADDGDDAERADDTDRTAENGDDVEEGDSAPEPDDANAAGDGLATRLSWQEVTSQSQFQSPATSQESDGEQADQEASDQNTDAATEDGDGEAAPEPDDEAQAEDDVDRSDAAANDEEPPDLLDGEPIDRESSADDAGDGDGADADADSDSDADADRPRRPEDRGEENADTMSPLDDWERDRYFEGGLARVRPEATRISGTRDDDLYLTQRRGEGAGKQGEFSYAIPVPEDGTYQVRLHFAETYWGAPGGPEDGEGARVFTVSVEGEPELRNYDIYDDVGAMTAVIKEIEVDVEDGELDLGFIAKRDQPTVAAIEILAEPDGERWVDVDRASQSVELMVGEQTIARYQASMSAGRVDDFQDTMPGSYQIQSKIAELTYTPYADNYFMYWAGFDPSRENGFHSWVMDDRGRVVEGGDGPTWGCIATAPEEAAEIYAFVEIGTRVEIR